MKMRTATSLSWPAGQQMKKEVEQTSCAGRRRRVGKAWRISINATPNARASTATFKTMSSISTRYPLRSRVTSSFSTTEISTWQKRSTEVKSWLRSLERACNRCPAMEKG
ncbi:hypothetical protein VTN96DRAFT_5030 [Rasamsonia emersonii]